MEAHRTDPVCASCHQLIDPFGFALENFDLVGRWRDERRRRADRRHGACSSTARRVDGPAALRAALLERSDAFVTALTEKLMTYALGRILEAHDKPAVRRIVARRGRRRLSILERSARHREQRAVSHADEAQRRRGGTMSDDRALHANVAPRAARGDAASPFGRARRRCAARTRSRRAVRRRPSRRRADRRRAAARHARARAHRHRRARRHARRAFLLERVQPGAL